MNVVRRRGANPPKLRYIYRNWTRHLKPTDESHQLGAGNIDVRHHRDKPIRLTGVYWTNRGWHIGLSPAGTIELTPISEDPDAAVTIAAAADTAQGS